MMNAPTAPERNDGSPSADALTRFLHVWDRQIIADHGLSRQALRHLLNLKTVYLNRAEGTAWPSQQTIGADLGGLKPDRVRQVNLEGKARGHSDFKALPGRGRGVTYWLRLHDGQTSIEAAEQSRGAGERKVIPLRVAPANVRTVTASSVDDVAVQQAAKPKRTARRDPHRYADDFSEFWRNYPKRVSRGSAEAAYGRARDGGATAEEILAGALRYSAERIDQDPKFTAHAATWLNGKRWLDESAPQPVNGSAAPASYRTQQRPLSHAERVMMRIHQDRE